MEDASPSRPGEALGPASDPGPAPREPETAGPGPSFASRTVHLFVLSALGLAWPVARSLAEVPELLLARGARAVDLHVIVGLLFVVVPLALVLAEAVVGLAGRRLGRLVHLLAVGALGLAAVAAPLRPILEGGARPPSADVLLVAGVILGLVLAFLYARARWLQRILTWAVVVPVLLAGLVLRDPAFRPVIEGPGATAEAVVDDDPTTTVVVLALDELPVSTLLGRDGRIDPVLFPNLARLAADGTFHRNASTVHDRRGPALSALVTGARPRDADILETTPPRSLFTLLGATHRMHVAESVTRLCPPGLAAGPRPRRGLVERLTELVPQLARGWAHAVLPAPLRRGLPPPATGLALAASSPAGDEGTVDAAAGGAPGASRSAAARDRVQRDATRDQRGGAGARARRDGAGDGDAAGGRDATGGETASPGALPGVAERVAAFRRWIDGIDSSFQPTLHFAHLPLPAGPWTLLPSGRSYDAAGETAFAATGGGAWIDKEWAVSQGLQRHLLQLGSVDTLVGELIARLEAEGVYDRSLVILTAVTGLGLTPGQPIHRATRHNVEDAIRVPLVVKTPFQPAGRLSDRNVELVDVLPTIMDVLGLEVPWVLDGRSLEEDVIGGRSMKTVHTDAGEALIVSGVEPGRWATLERRTRLYGPRPSWDDILQHSVRPTLSGVAVADLPFDSTLAAAVHVEALDRFDDVDPADDPLPLLVEGRVVAEQEGAQPGLLALAVDGRIATVTGSWEVAPRQHAFAALLPPDRLTRGRHDVRVFSVRGPEHDPRLSALSLQHYELVDDAETPRLLTADGTELSIGTTAIRGLIDSARVTDDGLRLVGWSANVATAQPAEAVLVFAGGRFLLAAPAGRERAGVATAFDDEALRPSGFEIVLPHDLLGDDWEGRLAVFGRVGDAAGRLPTSRAADWIARPLWTRATDGTDALVGSDDTIVEIRSGAVWGVVERAALEGDRLMVEGWAFDPEGPGRVDEVVLLADGRHLHAVPADIPRSELAASLGRPDAAPLGFDAVPLLAWIDGPPAGRVSVFALAGGRASELVYGEEARWLRDGTEAPAPESGPASPEADG